VYDYDREKAWIFTDQGQRQFLRIRDRAKGLCKLSGAVTMGAAISGESGSSWEMMACVDRLPGVGGGEKNQPAAGRPPACPARPRLRVRGGPGDAA